MKLIELSSEMVILKVLRKRESTLETHRRTGHLALKFSLLDEIV